MCVGVHTTATRDERKQCILHVSVHICDIKYNTLCGYVWWIEMRDKSLEEEKKYKKA